MLCSIWCSWCLGLLAFGRESTVLEGLQVLQGRQCHLVSSEHGKA
jgi:hypothetical protein